MRGVDGVDQEALDALMKEMMEATEWLRDEVEGRMGANRE
jgi:cell division FtsZ-interacting protein ZapD